MSADFFTVLLHPNVVELLRSSSTGLRCQLQKTLERLQLGYWENGTRVKLLRGARKLVYEARVTRGDRLLFTVAKGSSPLPPHEIGHHILAWDLVHHDDVDHARRRNLVPEAGFLDFELLAHAELEHVPIAPEAVLPGSLTDIDAAMQIKDDPANRISDTDELTDSIRWFRIDPDIVLDDEQWQALLDDGSVSELELRLSREQAEAVFADGPVLLRGTAGSGKTTVGVYRLARAAVEHPRSRLLYVTYSDALLASAERLFHDLFKARRQPAPTCVPDFMTFPQLYARILGDESSSRVPLRYPVFERWYQMVYRRSDGALAWEEIRSIVKGACLDPARQCLSFGEYEELGRKRAPMFVGERPRLYRVFRKYADWCRREGRTDDIDVARKALAALRSDPKLRYHQVACDEGQDLTELEMLFLLELTENLPGMFFAADPQQIVNPSGFRWAELRTLIRRERRYGSAPEIRSLTRNYRSVQSVVSLANALLTIQRERTGRCDDDDLQATSLKGASPVLVSGNEDDVLEHLRGFGPRCAVVTSSTEEAERVGRKLDSERVFDVVGAKGLEFDGCVLWNMIGTDVGLWRKILLSDQPMKEDPVARRAIHHLYVGSTRARRYLGVYESAEEAADLWLSAWLRAQVERDSPAALAKFMLFAASPEEWSKEGTYFLERKRFRQAAECFRRAGDAERQKEAVAAFRESVEDFEQAGTLYQELGQSDRAARCFERAGQHAKAARAYMRAERWREAAQGFEQAHQFREAADAFRRDGDLQNHRRCLQRHLVGERKWLEAARLAHESGDLDDAADLYDRGGRKKQARELRLRAARDRNDHAGAARLLEAVRDYAGAACEYDEAGQVEDATRCRAIAAERAGDLREAADNWVKVGDAKRAQELRAKNAEKEGRWLQAAELHDALDRTGDVSRCLRNSDSPKATAWLAAARAARKRDYATAAMQYEECERYTRAHLMAKLAQGRLPDEEAIWRLSDEEQQRHYNNRRELVLLSERCRIRQLAAEGKVADIARSGSWYYDPETERCRAEACESAGHPRQAAQVYLRIRDLEAAQRCYDKAGDRRGSLRVKALTAEANRDYAAAAELYKAYGNKRDYHKNAARALEMEGKLEEAADWYDRCRMTAQARRCREWARQPDLYRQQPWLLDEDEDAELF